MNSLSRIPIKQILFIDIETVPESEKWENLDERTQSLWDKKTFFQRKESSAEEFYEKAGIMAEFGKIVCITCGLITENEKIKLKSFCSFDEKKVLEDFNNLLASNYFNNSLLLCAHNGKEFDFPYLARRMMINQIETPNILQMQGKKPWEIPHLDTMELWKFGDYKHYTSLDLLSHIFNLPSPKSEMDGSQVAKIYYEEKDLDKIKRYCEQDVITLINVFRKMRYENTIDSE